MTVKWTVVDEFNKRLGKIMDQHARDIEAANGKWTKAHSDLFIWFDKHYDGEHDVAWPKEEASDEMS